MGTRNAALAGALLFGIASGIGGCGGGGGGGDSGSGGTASPPPPAATDTWLVMVYMAGDNNLERFVPSEINAMEAVPASASVTIAVEADTFRDAPVWGRVTAQRFDIAHDSDPNTVTSPVVEDLGEINTSSATAVEDFVVWATGRHRADHNVLVLWDHGGQWVGWGSDQQAGAGPLSYATLKSMFAAIQSLTGIAKLDLVGFESCLMAGLEVDQMLAPYATYRVASCELGYLAGGELWDMGGALGDLVANPGMTVESFGRAICDRYIAKQNALNITDQTLSLVRLADVQAVVNAVDAFAADLRANLGSQIGACLAPSRRTAEDYPKNPKYDPGKFVDLRHFASLVASSTALPALIADANNVTAAVDAAVAYRVQGVKAPNHRGMSVYFPNCPDCDASQPAYASVDLATGTQWFNFVTSYQTALATDQAGPAVTVNGPADGSVASPSAPATINFTVNGADLVGVSGEVSTKLSASLWLLFGEVDFGIRSAGTYNTTWDGKVFAVSDGTRANYLSPISAKEGTTLYVAQMKFTPSGGTAQDVVVYLDLNVAGGSGSIIGVYAQTAGGAWSGVLVSPGDSLATELPEYDSLTEDISGYLVSTTSLVVPAGGLSSLVIYKSKLAAGSYDFDIFAEDYAENEGTDSVTLVVP